MAQLVEHILGKDEVPGPNPGSSSRHPRGNPLGALVFYKALCTRDGSVTTQARGCREVLPGAATAFCPHIPHPSIAHHPRRKNTPEPPYPPRRTKPVRNIRHRRISGFRREGSIPDGANCDRHPRGNPLGALVFYRAFDSLPSRDAHRTRGCREMLPCAATAFCPHIPHPSIAHHPRRKNTPEPPYPPRRTKPVRNIRHRRISGFGFRALDAREIQLLHATR